MNIRDLKYIIELSREQSFAKAAKKSFVSQPALSMQIKKLEEELGVQIFERKQKTFLITKIGNEILKKAEIILRESEEIKNIAKNSKDPYRGEIKIGAFPTLSPYFFPSFVKNLHKKFPKLKIFLIEEKTDLLNLKLQNGEIDCAFLASVQKNDFLASEKIFSENFLLAVPKNHQLSSKKKIQSKDLKGMELMLLEDGHCLRDQALEACSMMGSFEKNDFKASSLETLRHMVASDTGITFIPEIAVKKDDKINYLEIANPPKRTVSMYWRKSSPKIELLKEIAKLAKIKNGIL